MAGSKQASVQVRSLTCLRFVAAAGVVLYHFAQTHLTTAPGWVRNLVANGYIGVSFFFVLSGFILTYTYTSPTRPIIRRDFWIARVARVYPVYALSLALSLPEFVGILLANNSRMVALAKGLFQGTVIATMLQGFIPWAQGVWNSPAWSLSVEAFFYLSFPAISARMVHLERNTLWKAMAGVWLLSLVGPICWIAANPDAGASSGLLYYMVTRNPLLHLPQFLLGALTGCLWLNRGKQERDSHAWLWLGVSAAAAMAFVALAASRVWAVPLANNGLFAPLFAVLTYALVQWETQRRPRIPGAAVLLGDASYSVYILQVPVFFAFERLRPGGLNSLVAWLEYFAILVAISSICYLKFETTARQKVRGWLSGGRQRLAPQPAPTLSKAAGRGSA